MSNLKSLSVQGQDSFLPLSVNEHNIHDKNLVLLTNLTSLKFNQIAFPREALEKLTKLESLEFSFLNSNWKIKNSQDIFGVNFILLDTLRNLKFVSIPLTPYFFNISEIQKKFPHVHFRFLFERYNTEDDNNNNENRRRGFASLIMRQNSKNVNSYMGYYEGEFAYLNNQNIFQGQGKQVYFSGEIYEGEWKNHKREGKGKYIYSYGDIYEGQFSNNVGNGKGVFRYIKKGDRIEGTFENGQVITGILYRKNGSRYEGNFLNFKPHKYGIEYYTDGSRFEGTMINSFPLYGKKFYPDGSTLSIDHRINNFEEDEDLYY